VTFNDDAMARVMILLDQASKQVAPLSMNLFSAEQQGKLPAALAKGFEYILEAPIVQSGKKTVWCAQHDPKTYAPMASPQAAIAWYKQSGSANTAYVSRPSGSTDDDYNPIQAKSGATMWHRFSDLTADVGFFSGRLPSDDPPGAGKKYDIMQIEAERRYGYQWGGAYGTKPASNVDAWQVQSRHWSSAQLPQQRLS
jgi:hypothetical protein